MIWFIQMFIRFIGSTTFINALKKGDFDEVAEAIGEVEHVITQGFLKHDKLKDKVERKSSLTAFLFDDLPNLKANTLSKRISNIQIFLTDILKYHQRLENSTYKTGKYEIYKNETLDEHFWRNVSTGLSWKYRHLKAMFANNHILSKLMDEPAAFTGRLESKIEALGTTLPKDKHIEVGLESGSRYVDKIDDAMIAMEVPELIVKTAGNAINLGKQFIRSTYDSKFYILPDRIGDAKTLKQQIHLTFQDRVKDELVPILRKIIDSDLTPDQQAEAIEKLIPVMFQHYVVKPKDTKAVSQSVNDMYAEAFKTEGRAHFEAIINTEITGFDSNFEHLAKAVERGIDAHAEDHFRTGAFVVEHSDLKFFDW